jgi:serine/threonine-protein kinase RsbW
MRARMPRASRSSPPGRARRRSVRERPRKRTAARTTTRTIRFRMASRRDAVAPTVDRVLATAKLAGLQTDQRENLAVAVAEALSNAAVHGNRLHPEHPVHVLIHVVPRQCVVVEVSDLGAGFDANQVSDPTHPARVLMPGGRGIFLMRQLVDRVEYNEAGNRVRLTVERRRAARGKATA